MDHLIDNSKTAASIDTPSGPVPRGTIPFHFITAVWGAEYTNLFLDFCLPNQLTDQNLRAFKDEPGACYKLFTSAEDSERIEGHPWFKKLQSVMKTDITFMEGLEPDRQGNSSVAHRASLDAMVRCHRQAIIDANREGAALFFLMPDMVISDRAFLVVKEYAYAGFRAVAVANLRLDKETFIPACRKEYTTPSGEISLDPRSLVRLAIEHLHPLTQYQFPGSKFFPQGYSHIYQMVGEHGLLMRSPHYHPLFVWPRSNDVPYYPLDGGYHVLAVPDKRERMLVTDSDKLISFELSRADKVADALKKGRFNRLVYAARAVNGCTDTPNRTALLAKVRIHGEECDESWLEAEKRSDQLIKSILTTYAVCRQYHHWYTPPQPEPTKIPQGSTVVIFGGGAGCEVALSIAKTCGWEVAVIIDNDQSKWGGVSHGLPVYGPERLAQRDFDCIVIASDPGRVAISAQLDALRFSREAGEYFFFRDQVSNGAFTIQIQS